MARVDRTELLASIETLLAPHKGTRQLGVFPDTAAEFASKYLKSKHGAWLLGYAGGRRIRGSEGAPGRAFGVDVTILSRRLSGDAGALADVGLIEEAVDGKRFLLDGVGYEIEARSDRFTGEDEQVWQYVLRLDCTTL